MPPPVISWLISTPTVGSVPVTEENFIAFKDENWFSLKIEVPDPTIVGFLTIPIWANFVSIGKSLVESSNLAYIKILSVPNSLYKSYPCPLDGGMIGIKLANEPWALVAIFWLIDPKSTCP